MADNNANGLADENLEVQEAILQQFGPVPGGPAPPLPAPNANEFNNNQGVAVPGLGPPPPPNNNNNDDDDDEWPNNAPGPAAPPAAPKPPKPSKFATALTAAEKAALQTPRAAQPQSFGDDVRDRVEDALYQVLKVGFDKIHPGKTKDECIQILRFILKETKAVLSGGYILKQILNVPDVEWTVPQIYGANVVYQGKTKLNTQINSGVDIDFYVSCKNLIPFYVAMIPLFQGETIKSYEASFYCKSFLRKNGIRTVYKILRPDAPDQLSEMDIMAVRNARSPLDVVTNFDLTVCQVWYDGTSVKGTDPEHVLNKVTYLQGDYVKTYLQGNRFLDWRLSKYSKRGFKIMGDPSVLSTMNPLDVILQLTPSDSTGCRFADEPRVRIKDDPKRWLIRALLRFSITGKYFVNGTLSDYGIQKNVEYSDASKKLIKSKISPLDGYDTDDFVENPQLLRDRVVNKQDPIVVFANTFFDLFNAQGVANPFDQVIPNYYINDINIDKHIDELQAYESIMALKPKVLEYIPPPALPAPAGGRRMTRRRR
jgi:hypothetical protein